MRHRAPAAMLAVLAFAACAPEQVSPSGSRSSASPSAIAQLVLSDADAAPGSLVAARVTLPALELSGLQGHIRFDTTRLRYEGQTLAGETLVLVNHDSARVGNLWFLGYRARQVEAGAFTFVFRVAARGYAPTMALVVDEAVRDPAVAMAVHAGPGALVDPALVAAPDARPITLADWVAHLQLEEPAPRLAIQLSPGDATRYGDPSLNGTVSALDAALTANVALALQPLLSDPGRDYVIASNVAPANLPGLGEANDALPPGLNADGSRTVTVLDVSAIRNETLGLDQPIVGELVPGRTPVTNRVALAGLVDSGEVRTLSRDTIYELAGALTVARKGRLVVQAGTRVEATGPGSVVIVERAGLIEAIGTLLQPVVFTCKAPATPGCWRGVQLHGFAVLNNGRTTDANGDVYPCPEKSAPAGSGPYGGCLPNDGSGTLRYVRIEYAGESPEPGEPGAGLRILANGASSVLRHVQVHASGGDGIVISGGNADLREIVITRSSGTPLRWADGWNGRLQFLAVQQDFAGGSDLVVGSSYGAAPTRTPISAPVVYNATLIGSGTVGERGLVLAEGSGGVFRNIIVLRTGAAGLDIDGAESCALATSGVLDFSHGIVDQASPAFASDADCIDEDAWAQEPLRSNRVVSPQLLAPFATLAPDWRSDPLGPADSAAASVPVDGFLDPSAQYVGALPPASGTRNVIPWSAGWTRGWSGTP